MLNNLKSIDRKITAVFLLFLLLITLQCGNEKTDITDSEISLPNDILGVSLGMKKEDAEKRLREIADFLNDGEKRQQIWQLKDTSRFKQIAVGYDKEDQIRFVTAFADPKTAKEKIRFSEVGDLSKAKAEILPPHYRYTWQVGVNENGRAEKFMTVYGDNPDFATMYSIGKVSEEEEEHGKDG